MTLQDIEPTYRNRINEVAQDGSRFDEKAAILELSDIVAELKEQLIILELIND